MSMIKFIGRRLSVFGTRRAACAGQVCWSGLIRVHNLVRPLRSALYVVRRTPYQIAATFPAPLSRLRLSSRRTGVTRAILACRTLAAEYWMRRAAGRTGRTTTELGRRCIAERAGTAPRYQPKRLRLELWGGAGGGPQGGSGAPSPSRHGMTRNPFRRMSAPYSISGGYARTGRNLLS